ncbi:MAG: ParB N-terminal domain-containing protein [Desulfoarculaceae bacterium]|nr:ParB N-terminal domain-containing protein [Desulfoarculaceae bacterium]
MSTHPQFKIITLDSINTTPNWTVHPFLDDTPSPALKQSLEESGILHPPVVQQAQDGTFNLVCGRRRLYAVRHYFKQTSLPCLVIQPALPPSAFFLYILTDQQSNGPLSPMEIAFFLNYCLGTMDEKDIADFFLPRLGYKKQTALIQRLTRLSTLEETIQRQVHHGLISDKTAFELLALPSKDRMTLSSLFDLLQPGTGKQNRIVTLSRDLALRSHKTISSLFAEQKFKEILVHKEMNPPQKAHTLLELLQKNSYPRSSEAEQLFKEKVRRLKLPDNYEITHSLNFEKDEVYLTKTFVDWESCEKDWHQKKQ